MQINRTGVRFIINNTLLWLVVVVLFWLLCNSLAVNIAVTFVGCYFAFFVFYFHRIPRRDALIDDSLVIAPADGTIVSIEEVEEDEFFHDRRIRVSVFMTFFNVHINWYPVSGEIVYYRYHPADKFVAAHTKNSDLNEHTSIVVATDGGKEIMFRQIAGIIARRIECEAEEGKRCDQCGTVGMIRFGSRVDVFLPADAEILVNRGDIMRGQLTPLARI